MLARRVIAISADKAVAKQLGAGLMAAGGSPEVVPSLDTLSKGEIQAALVVLHLADRDTSPLEVVNARLKKDAAVIVIVPTSDLKVVVAAMQSSTRVAGLMVADELATTRLSAMATRILYGDIFGLEKVVPWGTRVYSNLVGDYQEKSVCIAQISDYAGSMGVRRKYREAIEQVTDELLMNALYDAPIDLAGKQLFADIPTKTRISLRMEQKAVVQYACDAETFTISVRDSFGTLDRDTVLRYLHKCLYAEQQIDRKAGGAGLGLYIMANATTQLLINNLPGVATEVICTFDLDAPKVMLKEFGFFHEKIDASGRLAAGRSTLHPHGAGASFPIERRHGSAPASRGVIAALSGAIVLLLALIGMVAYPKLVTPPAASVEVRTTPDEAQIEIDGRSRGVSAGGRLLIEGLEVGKTYRVTAVRDGWNRAETVVQPVKGQPVTVELRLEPRQTTVLLDSDPPGATVVHDGRELGTTPLTVTSFPPSTEIELVFRKTGYRDVTKRMRVPRHGAEASLAAALSISRDFGTVTIDSTPPGAQIYQNGELLAGMTTPVVEHLIQANKDYRFTLTAPGFMPATVRARLSPGDRAVPVTAKLEPGGSLTVSANLDDAQATVHNVAACTKLDLPMRDCALPNGTYTLVIESRRPWLSKELAVTINGEHVALDLELGVVAAGPGYQLAIRRDRTIDRIALDPGTHRVTIVSAETGEQQQVSAHVVAGKTTVVP